MQIHRSARATLALGLTPWLLASCAATGVEPLPPVPPAASEAFARARDLRDQSAPAEDPELLQALAEARALAPGWLAPARMEDDVLVEALRGPEALERRRFELVEAPRSAGANYLVARLEGRAAGQRFERAAALDPEQAWVHLGLSWWLSQRTRDQPAQLKHARLAEDLARDPWERAFLQLRLASLQLRLGLGAEALATISRCLESSPGLRPADSVWLRAEAALLELDSLDLDARKRGFERALATMASPELSARDLERLALKAGTTTLIGTRREPARELELALAARGDELSRELRARLLSLSDTPLARALSERESSLRALDWGDEVSRLGAFERGWYARGVESWLARVPIQGLAEDRLPRRASLRELVNAERELSPEPEAHELERLADALLAAGWFDEAAAVADHLGGLDLSAGLELRERAAAGSALVDYLGEALANLQSGKPDFSREVRAQPGADAGSNSRQSTRDLDDLLRRWELCFERFGPALGASPLSLEETPRQEFGPFGSLLHPGPAFSDADEAQGLGCAGQPVPGLSQALVSLGRFAIVGQVAGGGGPDATLLRLLHVEQREGTHLGTPWRGTVAWCEGTDILSRAGQQGARVAGAALHEGYWVDVAVVRKDLDRWHGLERRFGAKSQVPELQAALAVRGVSLLTPVVHEEQRSRERRQLFPILGEADRVRLAVLAERAGPGESLGEVSLDELVAAVARHEEGHLCDRTRFLPLSEHLGGVIRFVFESGFSPRAVQERLEYRAHLTALCVADDPRLPLVEALETSETTSSAMPHGAAYRQLLRDLLLRFEQALLREPARWPEVDPGRTLVHQLHLLSAEQVRTLALELAEREGLSD